MPSKSNFRQASLCFSSISKFECVNCWTIRSFKRICDGQGEKQGQYRALSSAPFAADLDGSLMWALAVQKYQYTRENQYTPAEYRFVLQLKLQSDVPSKSSSIDAYYSIKVARANGKTFHEINDHRNISVGSFVQIEHFTNKQIDQSGALGDDEDITITSKIIACKETFNLSHCLPAKPIDESTQIELDFLKLLEGGEFSDITIEAKGASFKAHKAILANKSEYFKAMFNHNTIEAATGRVEVIDIDPEVMRAILRYIYSGRTDFESLKEKSIKGEEEEKKQDVKPQVDGGQNGKSNDSSDGNDSLNFYRKNSFAIELLEASDMFQLEKLKQSCEFALGDKISMKSAVDLLEIAHIYRAVHLKSQVVQFMIAHAKEFRSSRRLLELTEANPELSTNLLRCLLESLA